jgi:hypothetical protein
VKDGIIALHQEVVGLLQSVLMNTVPVVAVDASWDDVYAGNFRCIVNGHTLTIFNDCDEFDYVDRVEMADGRTADYADFEVNPVDAFTLGERDEIKAVLKAAKLAIDNEMDIIKARVALLSRQYDTLERIMNSILRTFERDKKAEDAK